MMRGFVTGTAGFALLGAVRAEPADYKALTDGLFWNDQGTAAEKLY
jgi:hypothetical protein